MGSVTNVEQLGRVLTIEINRPNQLNALNSTVLSEIRSALERAQHEQTVGAIVIRGRGDRAFSAGADLDEIRGLSVEAAQSFIHAGQRTMSAIADSVVPVVAEVDGFALGGGFELMLSCHVVIASDRSQFGLPEARIGCIPGFGGTQRLAKSVGKPAALLMMLGGERIGSDRAWQTGLLSVPPLPPEDTATQARRQAELIASGSRSGVANILDAARPAFAAAALDHEAALAAISIAGRDGQEGIASFAERRAPTFHEDLQ
ncbi:enoyl-CoA hydratase/isomerase family protein [Rhodococcus sp. 06-156-3C]|uniref:enoyl-CoA hydratase/isomerase family protein n=1 Tax=Nocardiaceae TaxID=85025 RepID=UPI000522FEDF|nr:MULTISPECIES: enoyl-CoA hydratase/isomerase family protein [Rhodococcus]OZD11629.1 enoyl-CoA hydratase/isomerase family protein [Rhodococcus sp. 06-156-4C]OZD15471.1 enoyl-CoA hydratase/isomerase family protein [Rhodococcus sp. 06-156-4a]OZD23637.1 enoyl-CoA hydratase/isomerase family protein [Rhodococcus sp. 06-156-3C]OZD27291.1 enoyl-CoA hydratase/isomerase family protein [Rhodococcus sp. 06-156-3b]OZD31313.1 enoyl-CoA hydratase/isomerase family protein [Rhodococcus sp. 06-156-3]